ncbi:MAG: TIGR01440 family protein [Firmicutes bacterium]|nr:TIGR01440 family protein [Bacillota bacterium]
MHLASLTSQTKGAVCKLLSMIEPKPRMIFVVGCSTSEIMGEKIGSASNIDTAEAVMAGLLPIIHEYGLYLAVQCCEHLNRALVVERECMNQYLLEEVTVIPHKDAGGALAAVAMKQFQDPVVVETISAHSGMDIGDTIIGMHLKKVAVPVRLDIESIGHAHLTFARTRPKLIGGRRAKYPS